MAKYFDRVMETSTTTGTGDFTLAGAVTGYQSFGTAFAATYPTQLFGYTIVAVDGSGVPSGQWETGEGYLSAANTLKRTQPRDGSSGATTAVNFSAGTSRVFLAMIADDATDYAQTYGLQFGWL